MEKQRIIRIWTAMIAMILCLSILTAAFAEYTTLRFGDESAAVTTLQKALKRKGYYKGTVDGVYGQGTRSAVYRYQKAIGITADGKAGNKTQTALYEGTSALNDTGKNKSQTKTPKGKDTIYYDSPASKVKPLQRALKAAGYYKGAIDGKFGDLTELAVRKFQTARGLPVHGRAGRATLDSLTNAQNKVTLKPSYILQKGSKGTKVSRLQTRLTKLGYKITDKKGTYGASTAKAVYSYQHKNGLVQSGKMTQEQYEKFLAATA